MCSPGQRKETGGLGNSRHYRGLGAVEDRARNNGMPSPHSVPFNKSTPYAPLVASVFSTELINTRHTTAGSQVLTTSPQMVSELLENSGFVYCCVQVAQGSARHKGGVEVLDEQTSECRRPFSMHYLLHKEFGLFCATQVIRTGTTGRSYQ